MATRSRDKQAHLRRSRQLGDLPWQWMACVTLGCHAEHLLHGSIPCAARTDIVNFPSVISIVRLGVLTTVPKAACTIGSAPRLHRAFQSAGGNRDPAFIQITEDTAVIQRGSDQVSKGPCSTIRNTPASWSMPRRHLQVAGLVSVALMPAALANVPAVCALSCCRCARQQRKFLAAITLRKSTRRPYNEERSVSRSMSCCAGP